jgi:2-polyprenyl-6-methoxyphenol hydroxylase-like FAD-dependent oxidoreductase
VSADRATQSTDELTVTVSGGSMAGLFAGIELDDAGHDVAVFERSAGELRSRGGGIVAQRSVRRFLARHCAVDPAELTTTTGERRYLAADRSVDTARAESMTFTSWDAVYRALRDAFPDHRYHMDRRVVSVSPATGTATFADGTETTADAILAAEGGRSSTRRQLFPDATPDVADYVAWRGAGGRPPAHGRRGVRRPVHLLSGDGPTRPRVLRPRPRRRDGPRRAPAQLGLVRRALGEPPCDLPRRRRD